MSQTRAQPSHDPLKVPKLLLSSATDKPKDAVSLFFRAAFLTCLVGSILILLFSAFSPAAHRGTAHWLRLPEPPGTDPGEDHPDYAGDDSSEPTNISHIVFSIGGSVRSWPGRSRYSTLWWQPNRTRGYAWLDEDPKSHIGDNRWQVAASNSIPYRVSEDTTRFKYSSSKSAVRIARIFLETFRLNLPRVRWFVMGDDDSVFFVDNLVTVLSRYDHREMWYIGGNSESVEQDVMHSYGMAFGGGGFALSYPLAARLSKIFDGCLDRYYKFYGSDQRVWACASEIGVPLTRELGFHQIDIRGNPYGLLAAHPLAPLVSLHHIDSVDSVIPHRTKFDSLETLMSSYRVDPPRILQQSFCYNRIRKWSIAISWGYTVRIYPSLVAAHLLETPIRTFKTWRTRKDGPFTFNTRSMEPDPCSAPAVYFLDEAQEVGQAGSLTSYNRSDDGSGKECKSAEFDRVMAIRRIVVSSMRMDPEYWKMAPRRQCCEIMDRGSIKNGILRLRIKKCRPFETITI
ncbi:uncharacterized protein LOC116188391 [Punica granatum]|uniref:Uncharacterized protein n=2 Tax=Punica granatum TaxID=22663 RepID=A0A218XS72_PUNGR|nr:uncharacterized protein LOC116188391 [Punica granatum]OWM87469.1 hypothetical protein CDL15_Pgr022580 [Punica granatum]PKI46599.1 hypothetical protein CRG98_032941 [Punica granatum]